jgi:hypothetical protein
MVSEGDDCDGRQDAFKSGCEHHNLSVLPVGFVFDYSRSLSITTCFSLPCLAEHTLTLYSFFFFPPISRYVDPLWSDVRRDAAIQLCVSKGTSLQLGGRLRVAR